MGEDGRMNAMDGPWVISPDVAWVDTEDIHVVALRPPYSALPWRLTSSAAAIWEGIADGLTRREMLAELGDSATSEIIAQVDDFLAELLRRDLIRSLDLSAGDPSLA